MIEWVLLHWLVWYEATEHQMFSKWLKNTHFEWIKNLDFTFLTFWFQTILRVRIVFFSHWHSTVLDPSAIKTEINLNFSALELQLFESNEFLALDTRCIPWEYFQGFKRGSRYCQLLLFKVGPRNSHRFVGEFENQTLKGVC